MPRSRKHFPAPDSDENADLNRQPPRPNKRGEPRGAGQLTGTKALMLAVLEDGIRSYLGSSPVIASEAEYWIYSPRQHSPFGFAVVCEALGLNPDAVRRTIKRMKTTNV